jgi:ABC-2 type transport system permease protein
MSRTFAIFRRELMSYFNSPVAFTILAAFVFMVGFNFDGLIAFFIRTQLMIAQAAQSGRTLPPPNLNEHVVRGLFGFISIFVPLLLVPVLTMRTFAEEKRSGTMELLLTAPITDAQIVMGKFLAAVSFYVVMLACSLVHVLFLYIYGNPDTGPILSGYLGLFLLGMAFIALGMFISSLTENQLVAAVVRNTVGTMFVIIGNASEVVGETVGSVFAYISMATHFQDFQKGVVDSRDVVYFVSFAAFFVFLTIRSVESLRWRG